MPRQPATPGPRRNVPLENDELRQLAQLGLNFAEDAHKLLEMCQAGERPGVDDFLDYYYLNVAAMLRLADALDLPDAVENLRERL